MTPLTPHSSRLTSRNAARRAVFLDRDGTINIEKDYLHKIEEFEFIPGACEAIRTLKNAGYLVVVVTNQSGVARGYYTLDDVERLHQHIFQKLALAGTGVDGFYVCPHHPEKGQGEYLKACDCRKGSPGMLLQAAEELNVDLGKSYMVGDKTADIEAGEKAGCTPILVLTGYGRDTQASRVYKTEDVTVCDDLAMAAQYIIEKSC